MHHVLVRKRRRQRAFGQDALVATWSDACTTRVHGKSTCFRDSALLVLLAEDGA
jgi:hypothetical protein